MAAAEATKALGKAADPEAAKAAADTLKRMEKHLEAQSWVDTVIEQDGLYRTGERRPAGRAAPRLPLAVPPRPAAHLREAPRGVRQPPAPRFLPQPNTSTSRPRRISTP